MSAGDSGATFIGDDGDDAPPPVKAGPPPVKSPPPVKAGPPPVKAAPAPGATFLGDEDDDAGPPPVKAGPPPVKAGPPPVTAGPPPVKAGPPPVKAAPAPGATFLGDEDDDAGPPPVKAGPPPVKAGPPPVTAGPPPVKAGPPPVKAAPAASAPGATFLGDEDDDAGPPPVKAGPPPVKAGPPPVSAGPPPVKAGPPPVKAAPAASAPGATFLGDEDDDAGPPPVKAGPPPVKAGPPPVTAGPPPVKAGPPPVTAGPPPVVKGAPAAKAPGATFLGDEDDDAGPPPVKAGPPPVTAGPPPVKARPSPASVAPPAVTRAGDRTATHLGEDDDDPGASPRAFDPGETRLDPPKAGPPARAPDATHLGDEGDAGQPPPVRAPAGSDQEATRLDELDGPQPPTRPLDPDSTRLEETPQATPRPPLPAPAAGPAPAPAEPAPAEPAAVGAAPAPEFGAEPSPHAASADADQQATQLRETDLTPAGFAATVAPEAPPQASSPGATAAATSTPGARPTLRQGKKKKPGAGESGRLDPPGASRPSADAWFAPTAAPRTRAPTSSGEGGASRQTVTLRSSREAQYEKLYAGKYRLLNEIARGGMGVVHRALHVDLNQIVALKVLLAGATATAKARQRFLFEAQAAARLKHPHILPVYDIGADGDELFFTMAFVQGKDLKDRFKEFDRPRLLDIMIKVTDAIAFAHQRGIIHRDLKPANVMLTAQDEPLVMDFGLAKEVDAPEKDADLLDSEMAQTKAGTVMGTPFYMSPEQASGETDQIDVRTDIYTLGVILYQLWTGALPFTAEGTPQLMMEILTKEPVRPREKDPTIPPDLEAIILKAMEKAPPARYQSAAALREDLERFRDGLPVSAQRATIVYRARKWVRRNRAAVGAAAALLAVVLGAAGWVGHQARARAVATLDRASDELVALSRERDEVAAGVAALVSGPGLEGQPLDERRARTAALRARLEPEAGLLRRLERARGPLEEYVPSDPRAAELARSLEEARAAAAGSLAALRDLATVHEELDAAGRGLERARALREEALAAFARAGVAPVASWSDLPAAIAAARALVAEVTSGATVELPPESRAPAEALLAHDRGLRGSLFAALRLAPPGGPEARLAQAGVEEVGAVERAVAAAEERVRAARLADRLTRAAVAVAALLRAEPLGGRDAVRDQRLEGAVLARTLVQRAAESDPATPGLLAARHAALFVHGWMLLGVKAYQVFDVEVRAASDYDPADLAALQAERKKNWETTVGLRKRIERSGVLQLQIRTGQVEVKGVADDVLQTELQTYTRQIDLLEKTADHPYLNDELDALRLERLKTMRARVEELKGLLAARAAEPPAPPPPPAGDAPPPSQGDPANR